MIFVKLWLLVYCMPSACMPSGYHHHSFLSSLFPLPSIQGHPGTGGNARWHFTILLPVALMDELYSYQGVRYIDHYPGYYY